MLNKAIKSKIFYGVISKRNFAPVIQRTNNIVSKSQYRSFGFFGGKRSTKLGEKCCKYGQNGKPLTHETAIHIYNSVENQVKAWSFNDDHTRLYSYFYCEEYTKLIEFVTEVAGVDMKTNQNKPEFTITNNGQVRIDLISHEIKGLSRRDFELATCIGNMNLKAQDVLPVLPKTLFDSVPENPEQTRYYYTKEYGNILNFLNAIVNFSNKLDLDTKLQFEIKKGDLQKVHYENSSDMSFWEKMEAEIIFDDFDVIPVKNPRKYRSEARMILKNREDDEIQKQLSEEFMSKAN